MIILVYMYQEDRDMKRLTTTEFIEKARVIHGDKFDYELAEYKGTDIKIKIKCKEHGIFEQTPNSHLNGSGCPDYSHRDFGSNTEEFVAKALLVHGSLYDYSLVVYDKNNRIPVKIICQEHGVFEQKPISHLNGNGCHFCGSEKRNKILGGLQKKELLYYINKANAIHHNFYDYSLVVSFVSVNDKVNIICPVHGIFDQTINGHMMQGKGCRYCAENVPSDTNSFIEHSKKIHNELYDYSLVEYTGAHNNVKIICHKHGIFEQPPHSHLKGHGCRKCIHTVSKSEMAWLDSLNIPKEYRQAQLRIDNKRINPDAFDPTTNTVYEFYGDYWHGNPAIYNSDDINIINKKSFGELYKITLAREVLIKQANYNLITIWERDWKLLLRSSSAS